MRALGRDLGDPLAISHLRQRVFEPVVVVQAVVVGAAVLLLLGFLVAGYFRVTYPYPMWVMEGPALQAVRRIVDGQPLYVPPSLEYVAPLYAPLYFYVSALVAKVVGVGLPALRLVSLAASVGSAAIVGYLVWRETRRRFLALVAAALFVSTTAQSSLTLDLARVDALCLLLLLAAVALARDAEDHPWFDLASGVATGLAVLTKQTAVVMAVPLLLNALMAGRSRGALAYLLGLGLTVGPAAVLLAAEYGRWPEFFLVILPRNHGLTLDNPGTFWTTEILPTFTIPLIVAPLFFIGRWQRGDVDAARFWLLASAGMLGLAWTARMNVWSDDNVLLPAFAVLTLLFALGIDEALRRLNGDGARPFRAYVLALIVVQFAFVQYNPRATSPLRSDVWAAERMVAALASLPGRVYGPDYSEFLYMAGKGEQAHGLSVLELLGGFGGKLLPEGSAWAAEYRGTLSRREFDHLVLDPDSVEFLLADIAREQGYVNIGPLFAEGDEFYLWGSRFTPRANVWVPRERAP